MKKVFSALSTILFIAGVGALIYLKWWNVAGQNDQGESCSGRAGCKSFWCLEHEFVGSAEQKSAGYCTDKCDSDSDCVKGLKCVVPTAQALDDLAKYGRPSKLCERVK
jgi:hypothetical protein